LEAEAILAHRGDALAQLRRLRRKSGSAAPRASGLRLALPPVDLAQHADNPSPSDSARVEAEVERDEVGAGGFEPVEQGDELAQRAGQCVKAGCDKGRGLRGSNPLQGLSEAAAGSAGLVAHDGDHLETRSG
jgi:hypothetical protein